LRLSLSFPGKSVLGIKLNDSQYDFYSSESGKIAKENVAKFVEFEGYDNLDEDTKKERIHEIIRDARAVARDRLNSKYQLSVARGRLEKYISENKDAKLKDVVDYMESEGFDVEKEYIRKILNKK
jgi:hypothetical protein